MDLWILSQDKENLTKISNVQYSFINDKFIIATYYDNLKVLGEYNSKKRALEVLNEIKRHIAFLNVEMGAGRFGELDFESDIVFEMPEK